MVVGIALREREASGRPIRVGMVGGGATGSSIALQFATSVPGIRLIARLAPEPFRQYTGAV